MSVAVNRQTESAPCRYEYRAWGSDLSPQRAMLRAAPSQWRGRSQGRECYIVPNRPDTISRTISAKIREGRLETKELLEEHLDLQLWRPDLHEPFPLTRATLLSTVAPALSLEPEAIDAARYDRAAFLDRLIAAAPHLTAMTVEKSRLNFTIDTVLVEFTTVTVGAFAMHTVAVEAEDPARTLRTATRLQLTGLPNRSYPEALRAMLAGGQVEP